MSCIAAIGQNRDRAAFAELFQILSGPITTHVLRMQFPREQAEDIMQDVMLRIWQRASTYNPAQGHALGWIFRITRNACIDHVRKTNPYPEPTFQHPDDLSHPATDQLIDHKRQIKTMQTAIDTLPPEQAALIRMAYFHTMTHKDMAKKLNLPLGTVKSRLRLAITHLRQQMAANPKAGKP
ncbi:MAG: hypothetical protein A2018_00425 [Alphaproteobacteria bacterium GWF2_58_20]|nr:MAG: hypothetical protein A2018_00425 [Alphaproteobacteria bacterium GWF2_58_20]